RGGHIFFFATSDGAAARVQLFDRGRLDISSHTLPGMTVGSIEGNGAVFLGVNNLNVGANNQSTTFSGVILDGGSGGGTGGSLTKVGIATLALTNVNIYTGGTTVDNGGLIVNNKNGSG